MLSKIFLDKKQFRHKKKIRTWLTATLIAGRMIFTSSCSMFGPVYVKTGYRTNSTDTIRNTRLAIRAPLEMPELAPLISTIASDTIRVKTGYRVTANESTGRIKEDICGGNEGYFTFSVEELKTYRGHIAIYIRGTLTRCSNNELIWRAEGRYDGKPGDDRLKDLVRQYRRKYGKVAELYTEPVYFLMRDIIRSLPDPEPVKN